MDNISYRRSCEDTATSMYLSFDAESTMSTACYKTLDAMTDISAIDASNSTDTNMNSTLGNNEDSQILSPLKTVKKIDPMTTNSPLRALPKNILREYKALCSTPSKEQLLKSVDVTRGSDAKCVDLGIAFLGVDDEQPAFFLPQPINHQRQQRYDDKENAIPESDDGSTLSVSSSVEITTSVIEKKRLNSVSTGGSLTGEESIEEIKVEDNLFVEQNIEKSRSGQVIPTVSVNMEAISNEQGKAVGDAAPKAQIGNVDNVGVAIMETVSNEQGKGDDYATPKPKFGNNDNIGATINEDVETTEELTPKVQELKEVKKPQSITKFGVIPKIAVLTSRNARRSVCEPNLQTNKPSRISTTGSKRQSLLPITKKVPIAEDIETEIPLLMDKLLKISNKSILADNDDNKLNKKDETIRDKKPQSQIAGKRLSVMGQTKGRNSLTTASLGEKRPFSFTQRMSVIVKTTLNSPARKIARKSVMSTSGTLVHQQQRRSIMTTKLAQNSRINKFETGVRRSMIPNSKIGTSSSNIKTTDNHSPKVKQTGTVQRKSLYPVEKATGETKINLHPTFDSNRIPRTKTQERTFTCNSCKEKFRVKSLLDAHRRSHEGDDIVPPILNKKSTTISSASSGGSSLVNPNQCKYCDKKFALLRALHIHLLQNCSKIPPSEKRKLQFTEMNHVEKARLPNFFHHGNGVSSTVSSTQATPHGLLKQNTLTQNATAVPKSDYGKGAKEKDFKNKSCDSSTVSSTNGSQPNMHAATTGGGSVQKQKKASAHSGVYRTPSKFVPCHICKLTFKSILDYTNHSLAAHGHKSQVDDSSIGNEMQML